MPFPIDLTGCLAYAPTNSRVKVRTIPFAGLRSKLERRGLHEGDEITCERNADGQVLVATSDGSHLIVEREYAVVIEVEPRQVAKRPQHRWNS